MWICVLSLLFWQPQGDWVQQSLQQETLELYDSFMIQNQIRKIILRRELPLLKLICFSDILKKQFPFTNTSKFLVSVLFAYIGRKAGKLWIKYTISGFFKSSLVKTTDTKWQVECAGRITGKLKTFSKNAEKTNRDENQKRVEVLEDLNRKFNLSITSMNR